MIYLEWAIAIIALTIFAAAFGGAMLHVKDRQEYYEKRRKQNGSKRRAD